VTSGGTDADLADPDITDLTIRTWIPLVYELDTRVRLVSRRNLGHPETLKMAMLAVTHQEKVLPDVNDTVQGAIAIHDLTVCLVVRVPDAIDQEFVFIGTWGQLEFACVGEVFRFGHEICISLPLIEVSHHMDLPAHWI